MKFLYIMLIILAIVSFVKMSFVLGSFALGTVAGIFLYHKYISSKSLKKKEHILEKWMQTLIVPADFNLLLHKEKP